MREQIELCFNQRQIMSEFYAKGPRKVYLDKCQRDVLWHKAKKGEISETTMQTIKKTSPALYHQISKSIKSGNCIQSAVFSECVYAQALADVFTLTLFQNCLEGKCDIPDNVWRVLHSYSLTPRYAYVSPDGNRMLIQAGGCGGVDSALITVLDMKTYTIEFKEPNAKSRELDLPKYGEDGRIVITERFNRKYPQFQSMLAEQRELNFFDVMGSNVNDFSYESIYNAFAGNYSSRKFGADVVCTEDTDRNLVMLPTNQINIWAWTGGEIRPAGRNHSRVWTPMALDKFLRESEAVFQGGIIRMPMRRLVPAKPRGGEGVNRYKINSLFFVYASDVTIEDETVTFALRSVQQLRPTIAGKMSFDISYEEVLEHYFPNSIQ